MLINREKLREKMFAKKITVIKLAKLLGITRSGLYKKLDCTFQFDENEIIKLVELFGKEILSIRTRG